MATVAGSNVSTVTWAVTSGPGSISSTGLYTAPLSLTTAQTAVVTATSTINTATPVTATATLTIAPNMVGVAGTITLQGAVNQAQSVTFQFQPMGSGSPLTENVTLSSTGAYALADIPSGVYEIGIKGSKWLQTVLSNVTVSSNTTGVNATLIPGDINGDNVINLQDLDLLIAAFGSVAGSSNWNANADLDCNGVVDLRDYFLLLSNFNDVGNSFSGVSDKSLSHGRDFRCRTLRLYWPQRRFCTRPAPVRRLSEAVRAS